MDICRNIWVKYQDACNLLSNISGKKKKEEGRKENTDTCFGPIYMFLESSLSR